MIGPAAPRSARTESPRRRPGAGAGNPPRRRFASRADIIGVTNRDSAPSFPRMFTGIVTDIGRVRSVARAGDTRFDIETANGAGAIAIGASVACAGICLTVVEAAPGRFAVEASAETLARTTAGQWRAGTRINLERALAVGDELGGHLVGGHVDGTTEVRDTAASGDSLEVRFALPEWLAPCAAPKGSIAIDGVSLTVNAVAADCFSVNLIAHTRARTTLGAAAAGQAVNVEIDMLARYVRRALAFAEPERRA